MLKINNKKKIGEKVKGKRQGNIIIGFWKAQMCCIAPEHFATFFSKTCLRC